MTKDESVDGRSAGVDEAWTVARVLVVALCFLLNMLDGTDLLVMSFIAPVIARDWSVSPERLGVLFSASLVGMALGCMLVAPLADRYGRRSLILIGLGVTASAMALSAQARDVGQLMWTRLMVGIGVGTIGVTMTSMAAEYAPRHHVSFAVGFVQAGWPLGAIITAFATSNVLPAQGWHSLLLAIGVFSAALLLLMAAVLPESLAFLSERCATGDLEKVNVIRARLRLPALLELPPPRHRTARPSIADLFGADRRLPSALLWSTVTLGYFVLYFVISWIPKLATQAGLPLTAAIYAGATYNLGAFIGTAALGWIATRYRIDRVIAAYLTLAAAAMLVFGGLSLPIGLTLAAALAVGMTVQGGFNGFWAMAARLYPPRMRNTGVGWALGVGRIGAVLGPIAGGFLVGAHVSLPVIFALFSAVLLTAAAMTLRIRVR